MQTPVGTTQELRHGLPQRMLDDSEAPLGLIHRAGPATTDFLGVPGFGDQPLQALGNDFTLGRQQVVVIQCRQLRRDGIVLLDQRTPRHFCGVGGQHQLDVQAPQLPRQLIRALPCREQAFEQFVEHPELEGLGLIRAAATHPMLLFGDVGQVEELIEGTRHRQQLIVVQIAKGAGQLLGTCG